MTTEIIAKTQVETARAAVRDWIDRCAASNAEIARIVGVDEKTVRHARADGWNPRVETLSLFEKLLPPGWQIGDPVPVSLPRKPAATTGKARAA